MRTRAAHRPLQERRRLPRPRWRFPLLCGVALRGVRHELHLRQEAALRRRQVHGSLRRRLGGAPRSSAGRLFSALPVVGLSAILVLPGSRSRPPSSLEPEGNEASVVVRHQHRRVRSCTAARKGRELRCDPSTVPADARTELVLQPVQTHSLEAERDEREPVKVFVGAHGTSGDLPLRLAPGTWEIVWMDAAPSATMTLPRGGAATVSLESTTGRCEKKQSVCVLASRPIRRTVDVAIQ